MATRTRIDDLELVVALSEEGNLSQAARRLGMSQPAMSKRLRVIEERLQLKLFQTGHTGTNITDSGRFFAQYAQQIVNSFHRGIHEARLAKQAQIHKLHIGVSPFQSPQLVEMLRTTELRLFRNLSVEIESAFSCDLLRKLQTHEIDVALVTSPPPTPSITTAVLNVRRFRIAFHEEHRLGAQTSLYLRDLAEFPWVFFSRNVHPHLHDLILGRAKELDLKPRIVHRIMYAEEVPALVSDGCSIAWLGPMGAARVAHGTFTSRPLSDREIRLETHLATWAANSSSLVSEFVRTFMKRYQVEKRPVQMVLPIAGDEAGRVG